MPLSDAKIRSLKPGEKTQKYADGRGLQLHVTPTGGKLWRFAYRFEGQQKELALGAYPVVKLAAARSARDDALRLLLDGRDPGLMREREKHRRRIAAGHKFRDVAEEWFANNEAKWVESYSSRLWSRLEEDLLPVLGPMPISDIEPIEVLAGSYAFALLPWRAMIDKQLGKESAPGSRMAWASRGRSAASGTSGFPLAGPFSRFLFAQPTAVVILRRREPCLSGMARSCRTASDARQGRLRRRGATRGCAAPP